MDETTGKAPAAKAAPARKPTAAELHAERLQAAQAAEKERQEFHADLRQHLHDANLEERNDDAPPHPTVLEHAQLRGLEAVKHLDPATMTPVDRPPWQVAAVVAYFHAHGLRLDSRISAKHFDRALDEALNGRV